MTTRSKKEMMFVLLPVLYGVGVFIVSLFIPLIVSIPVILFGIWNKSTAYGTLTALFLLDAFSYTPRTLFHGYPMIFFILGVVLFFIFNFIQKKLFPHAVF